MTSKYKQAEERFLRALHETNLTKEEKRALSELAIEMAAAITSDVSDQVRDTHEIYFARKLKQHLIL
jgi:hypothetical protein